MRIKNNVLRYCKLYNLVTLEVTESSSIFKTHKTPFSSHFLMLKLNLLPRNLYHFLKYDLIENYQQPKRHKKKEEKKG